jgi:hypothetical protein
MGADDAISEHDFLIAVGVLGAMRHDHLWLDAKIMIGMLTLDDERAFALYEAVIPFMGGRKAEMRSHLGVTIEFMRAIWVADLPEWQKGRAVGRLLEQLVRSRPNDWKAALHCIDAKLRQFESEGDRVARRGREYLADWITGHFYNLDEIRSLERVITEIRTRRPLRTARKPRAKGTRTA